MHACDWDTGRTVPGRNANRRCSSNVVVVMKIPLALGAVLIALHAQASDRQVPLISVPSSRQVGTEIHDRLRLASNDQQQDVALTLDACGGRFDKALVDLLIAHRIPATVFATRKWLDANRDGTALLLAHADLFDIEDHGAEHVPAVVGAGKKVYGIPGEPDLPHLDEEVTGGAGAIADRTGRRPLYYRGAGALYDSAARQEISRLGYQIAGFSVNADAGATLPANAVAQRLRAVLPGDVVIAHMNKPAGATAAGFAMALPYLERKGFRFVKLAGRELSPI